LKCEDATPSAYYQNVVFYRGISIECDALMRHFTLCFQSGTVVETLEKKQQNFWVRFSITPIHFQCCELGQQ